MVRSVGGHSDLRQKDKLNKLNLICEGQDRGLID